MTTRKKKPAGNGKQTPKTLREKTRKNLKEMEKSDAERNNRKKKLLIAALIGGAVLIAAGVVLAGVLAVRAFAPPVLGFRNVPAETEKAISGYAQKQTESGGKKWKIITIDPSLPMQKQIKLFKKTDILITGSGAAAEQLGAFAKMPSQTDLSLMPTAIRKAGAEDGRQYALPVLLDHYELSWNYSLVRSAEPRTIAALENAANKLKSQTSWPFMCAGGDDESLLNFIGALTEALGGENAWKSVRQEAENVSPAELVRKESLSSVLETLLRWRREGLLHPEWFRMTRPDVEAFMETNAAPFVFMSLSNHRKISQRTVEKYNSVFMPGFAADASRSLAAPAVLLLAPNKKRAREEAILLKDALLDEDAQTKLSGMTGLAPVSSTAAAPDRQANEARLWAAASERPLPSFYTALYPYPADAALLAKNIREFLQSDGAEN
ncbi:MAG: extracellular solute-binding protein [Spirochaetales bacterium]|nr:extracellular solute-binding protein [Spirochaetales bacterium]